MSGKVIVGYLDTQPGHDALALGRILAKARDAELAIVTVDSGEELADAARKQGADLVVLGSTHLGSVTKMVVGTTMQQVLVGADRSMAVAPPGFAARTDEEIAWKPLDGDEEDVGMRVVGVGFDGSLASRRALETATELAVRNGAALRIYSVVRRNASMAPDAPQTPTAPATTALEGRRAELHETVADLPPEVRAQAVLLRGFADDESVAASRLGVDLLIVGTHVGGHLHRLLHKRIAGLVASWALCPVLICPTSIAAPVAVAA